jgi:glycosyltransferase involved in cell wall biosynthesis
MKSTTNYISRKTCAGLKSAFNFIITKFNVVRGHGKFDLVILDDMFPHLLSAFRISEFNALLKHFNNASVYSNGITFRTIGECRDFKEIHAVYAHLYPDLSNRVHFFKGKTKVSARLCYVVFLNNANLFIDYIERCKLPFVLELYPGGGFHLDDINSNLKLRRLTSSPLLKKIIVTQKISFEYLINNNFCQPEQLELIYGGVFPKDQLIHGQMSRKYFPSDKKTFDICFVANKYMPQGRDKGYDVFIETALYLAASNPYVVFHVVGTFGPDDISASAFGNRIKFYGSRTTDFFPSFYGEMDVILSPNAPFMLSPGAFDGFPTGACVEAAMCGVAILCCDELKLNPFVDGEELVVISREPSEIAFVLSKFLHNPDLLYQIAKQGQLRFREVFSYEQQMLPRIKLLESCLSEEKGGT